MKPLILIIDPDTTFRTALVDGLTSYGFGKIHEAATAGEDTLETIRPNIIIFGCEDIPDILPPALVAAKDIIRKHVSIVILATKQPSEEDFARLFASESLACIMPKSSSKDALAQLLQSEAARLDRLKKLAFKERLNQVVGDNKSVISERVTQLNHLVESIDTTDENSVWTAINIAHQIKGTAANFGYEATGEIAAEIETQLKSLNRQSPDPNILISLKTLATEAVASVGVQVITERRAPAKVSKFDVGAAVPDGALAISGGAANDKRALARILLIDDDALFSEYVRKIGRQRLMEVVAVATLEEAEQKLRSELFDALLIDLNLGHNIDACTGIEEIRKRNNMAGLPMAFISASGSPEERSRATQAGAVLFLNKPLEPENFEAAVHHLLVLSKKSRSKILMIEDDEAFVSILESVLSRQGYDLCHVPDGIDILQTLDRERPDMLLIDVNLPSLNGFELCTLLRATPAWQSLPIIFVTAELGWQTRVSAFRAGADDYISKPIVEEELIAKVHARLERAKFMLERNTRDTITGVLVRTAFIEELHQMFRRCKAEHTSVAVAILDLDTFKKVNDLGGHLIGDSVLASLGRTLMSSFRCNDLRGRWGGDEFIIALESTTKENAADLMRGLLTTFRGIEFHDDKNQPFFMSFSAGIAQFPEEGVSAYELLKLADERLYESKGKGRSRISIGNSIVEVAP